MYEHRTMMFKYTDQRDIILDGRSIVFLSKEIGYNREHLALILSGKEPCTYSLACKIVNRLKPNEKVEDYFIESEV